MQMQAPGFFAALRRLLVDRNPDWMAAGTRHWEAWWRAAGGALPSPNVQQLAVIVSIQCVEDIPLHRGLLQLLSLKMIQPIVVLALPTASAKAIVASHALREGWASLVTLVTEAEMVGAIRRLPADMPLASFQLPAPIPQAAFEKIAGSSGTTNLIADWPPPRLEHHGSFLGPAGSHPGLNDAAAASFGEPLFFDLVQALEGTDLPAPSVITDTPSSHDATATCAETNAHAEDIWRRPTEIELVSVGRDELLAVLVLSDGEPAHVTAVQSASLAPQPKGLSLPILPRHASATLRKMQIHRLDGCGNRSTHETFFSVPPTNIEPWMLSAYLNRGGGGNAVARAFAMGTGCRLAYAEDEPEVLQDIPVVWGVLRDSDRILAQARQQRLHFFYIDHAYFDRGHGNSYRITLNRYEAGKVRKVDDSRLKQLKVDVQPWRKNGRSIIVCPPTDFFAAAHDCADWLQTTLTTLRLATDRPIIVREKPKPGRAFLPLAQALEDAHALVTHSSNVAIEAVCLGTPVFVSPTSAAAPIGQTNLDLIETPRFPSRGDWLNHLAFSQYSLAEIQNGTAWEILKLLEDCDFA
jgi:hypothetical protein